jgi:hypothetical protein
MKRFLLAFLLIPVLAFGDAFEPLEPLGTRSPSDLDTYIPTNNSAIMRQFRGNDVVIQYASASTLTVTSGSVMVCNAAADDCEMLYNSSATTVTWSDIDTGSEATSTTYYVYAVGSSSADTFTVKVSTNSTFPTGSLQYRRIGYFYNNSSGDITLLDNDNIKGEFKGYTSKSNNVSYLAETDRFVVANNSDGSVLTFFVDGSSSPSTAVLSLAGSNNVGSMVVVPAGYYWKVTGATSVYTIETN